MARYYRRRYTRVVKPKKKWATNIRAISFNKSELSNAVIGYSQTLCANSVETVVDAATVPTPTVIKVGNFKVQCDALLQTAATVFSRLSMYIMYIPEGSYVPSTALNDSARLENDGIALNTLVTRHPEWIMAWRQFDSQEVNGAANIQRVTVSSRLKRNLNSGDQICAVFIAVAGTISAPVSNSLSRLVLNGTCQFWTSAN